MKQNILTKEDLDAAIGQKKTQKKQLLHNLLLDYDLIRLATNVAHLQLILQPCM